jgi:hypothetical protein
MRKWLWPVVVALIVYWWWKRGSAANPAGVVVGTESGVPVAIV